MFKRIVAGALVAMMTTGMTGTSAVPVKADEATETKVVQALSETDEAKLEALYEEAEALEEELMAIYDEIEALDPDFMMWNDYEWTFEDFAYELDEELDAETLAEVEALFNEAIALEAKEDWEAAEAIWDQLYEMDIFNYDMDFEWTFEDVKSELKEDLDATTLAEVEALFNQAMAHEEADEWDEADAIWDQLYEMDIFNYEMEEFEEWTFEDLKEELKEGIDADVLASAEALFNEAMALEEAGDFDAAEAKWDALFEMDIFDYEEEDLD